MENIERGQVRDQVSSTSGLFPPNEFEPFFEQLLQLLYQEIMPVINEGFLLEKSITCAKIPKGTIKQVAEKIQAEMLSLSRLDFNNVESLGKIWNFINRLVRDVIPSNVRSGLRRKSDPLTEAIRSNEKQLAHMKRTSGMSQAEWRSVLEAIVTSHHLAYRTGYDHHQFEYWKSRRIVATFQAMKRVWKLMGGRWPRVATERLSRLVRIYGEVVTVFEHMLRYNLEMLADLPRPDGSRSTKPSDKATLGRLVRQAEQYTELGPLLIEIDVHLRNAIQHSTCRIALKPCRLVWVGPRGIVEESLADFGRRVKRLVVVTNLYLTGQQIAGIQILAKVRYLLSGDTTDISKRFPTLYTSHCQLNFRFPFRSPFPR